MASNTGRITCGEAMRNARESRGLSRKQLSDLSGVSPGQIRYYEVNHVAPTLYPLIELADALHISIDEYVGHRRKGMFDNDGDKEGRAVKSDFT